MKTYSFVYSSLNTAFRLPFGLSTQYLLFYSTLILHYDEVRNQQRFEYISQIYEASLILEKLRIF